MVRLLNAFFIGVAAAATAVYAAGITVECGVGMGKCPNDKPCCSQYGQCGVGAYCLGGCDPVFSNKLDSCVPAPMCKSCNSDFSSLDRIVDKTKYLGDPSKADWVADGEPLIFNNQLLLTMAPKTVGTVLASTTYVWYGKISATLRTSKGQGVVSAFILLADNKDEIDFEWIGVALDTTQTNYYFQGIPDYNNGGNISVSNTYDNFHTYEIDWKPDSITWSVDGKVGRVLNKKDTYNSTTKVYDYPQSPARVQLSLWPGGLASNAPGTIAWAGGLIDWNSQDIKTHGYYYVTFKDVKIECYNPPSGAKKEGSGKVSYAWNDEAVLEDNVVLTDKGTILKSLLGTGTNMTADYPKQASNSKSPTATQSGSSPSDTLETVPGLTGAGNGANGKNRDSPSGTGSAGRSSPSSSTGFSQGDAGSNQSEAPPHRKVLKGSILAVIVAVVLGVMIL